MKAQIATLSTLARLREHQVQEMLGRLNHQQNLCQRYRNNIESLNRLCGHAAPVQTSLQRHNQHRYKTTLHRLIDLQRRELAVAERSLVRMRGEVMQAMRNEKIVSTVLDGKIALWRQQLAHQEQKIQDGLAAQSWWRNRATGAA